MPFIAWVLFGYFALAGGVSVASMIAKSKSGAGSLAISILLTAGIYAWLLWAVVQLATR